MPIIFITGTLRSGTSAVANFLSKSIDKNYLFVTEESDVSKYYKKEFNVDGYYERVDLHHAFQNLHQGALTLPFNPPGKKVLREGDKMFLGEGEGEGEEEEKEKEKVSATRLPDFCHDVIPDFSPSLYSSEEKKEDNLADSTGRFKEPQVLLWKPFITTLKLICEEMKSLSTLKNGGDDGCWGLKSAQFVQVLPVIEYLFPPSLHLSDNKNEDEVAIIIYCIRDYVSVQQSVKKFCNAHGQENVLVPEDYWLCHTLRFLHAANQSSLPIILQEGPTSSLAFFLTGCESEQHRQIDQDDKIEEEKTEKKKNVKTGKKKKKKSKKKKVEEIVYKFLLQLCKEQKKWIREIDNRKEKDKTNLNNGNYNLENFSLRGKIPEYILSINN